MAVEFPVSADKARALRERMGALGIFEGDLKEQFTRSGGHGGQNVNKVSTCVVLTHVPSGIQVRCQEERTQGLNRFLARRRLADRLELQKLGRASLQRQVAEKVRRQKRRRSRRSKERMLQDKHHRSGIKSDRRGPGSE